MELNELKKILEEKLNKSLPSKLFLNKMRLLDENSRNTPAYQDPKYIPFYYWLGTQIQPKSLIEIGFRLGLFSSCFLNSCKSVERLIGFQQKTNDFYSPRLGIANVKDNFKGSLYVYTGDIQDDTFEFKLGHDGWDLLIINEEVNYDKHRDYLDLMWGKLNSGALIIMDYIHKHLPAKEAFFDFCKSKNRLPIELETRYGVGIIEK